MKTKDAAHVRSNLLIVALVECVIFTAVWLWNEYVATYATIILPGVMFVILVLSLIADWIEPSRIPRWYYYVMGISIIIPLEIGMLFMYIYQGNMDWLK
jgi:hypothetical protein